MPLPSQWRAVAVFLILGVWMSGLAAARGGARQSSIAIGRFSFPFSDNTLPSAELRSQNDTLEDHAYWLWDDALDFYDNYSYPLPGTQEADNLTILAKRELTARLGNETEFDRYASGILKLAIEKYDAFMLQNATSPPPYSYDYDLVYWYTWASLVDCATRH